MLIFFILGIPILLAAGAFFSKRPRVFGIINVFGYLSILLASIVLLKDIAFAGHTLFFFSFLYIDTLSAYFIFVISVVSFATALYSVGYIGKDMQSGAISENKAKMYYLLFNLFCFSMFFVPAVNNLGMLWVAIEMTTLISAFLVGFYNTKQSVEAAWKYIIICSVGIIFALLGTILFSYAFSLAGGAKSLNWTDMVAAAGGMDKNILKVAFIFILVGYGTKAGLAPMHTWLPDAHSQAVTPISALLSGVLLKTAIYAILRFGIIVIEGVGFGYFSHLMILLGLISLGVSCSFILVQKDLKRLLAYSSIEHVGIIAIGLGLGTPLAWGGALLHVFNHAVTKSLMFFGAGDIVSAYKRHNMKMIRGVIRVLPFAGVMTLAGMFALTGFPPFSIFVSELIIIIAAFTKGSYVVAVLFLLFIAIIFGAFAYQFGKMLFGNLPKGMAKAPEPLSGKLAFLFLFVQMLAVGGVVLFMKKDLLWIVQGLLTR
ncbi:MAG TPA: hydrogenase 4 subunit F [Candidatus Omnitrophota bacterium]|nr:hydrogenase 4 subunit F [Candidatus Omnitrophota bacterium]HPD84241.1 hydrogenase 4 subunit F [Candidatus Omnitrophota bacterium]HRZ03097.1 hydrogenase 4 subunit F [Candidatus Omnitrophota bacterium]